MPGSLLKPDNFSWSNSTGPVISFVNSVKSESPDGSGRSGSYRFDSRAKGDYESSFDLSPSLDESEVKQNYNEGVYDTLNMLGADYLMYRTNPLENVNVRVESVEREELNSGYGADEDFRFSNAVMYNAGWYKKGFFVKTVDPRLVEFIGGNPENVNLGNDCNINKANQLFELKSGYRGSIENKNEMNVSEEQCSTRENVLPGTFSSVMRSVTGMFSSQEQKEINNQQTERQQTESILSSTHLHIFNHPTLGTIDNRTLSFKVPDRTSFVFYKRDCLKEEGVKRRLHLEGFGTEMINFCSPNKFESQRINNELGYQANYKNFNDRPSYNKDHSVKNPSSQITATNMPVGHISRRLMDSVTDKFTGTTYPRINDLRCISEISSDTSLYYLSVPTNSNAWNTAASLLLLETPIKPVMEPSTKRLQPMFDHPREQPFSIINCGDRIPLWNGLEAPFTQPTLIRTVDSSG